MMMVDHGRVQRAEVVSYSYVVTLENVFVSFLIHFRPFMNGEILYDCPTTRRHQVQEEWTWKLLSTSPHNGLPSFIPTLHFHHDDSKVWRMKTLYKTMLPSLFRILWQVSIVRALLGRYNTRIPDM